jgi:hypothetical protein
MGDVIKMRAALKKFARDGVEEIGDDVMDQVFKGLDNPAMFREAWNQGVFSTSFVRAEHLYNPAAGTSIKPWETNFFLFAKGGQTMEYMEDTLRMATFHRWFNSDSADLFAEGAFAKSIVDAVHFDYTDLTSFEEKIKIFMPFYVWTRRNIPLQLRTLVQDPTYMMWFYRARSNWNETQLSKIGNDDPFIRQASRHGFIMPFTRNNDYGWSRMMWDPQLPMYDLDVFPWGEGPQGWINPMWAVSAMVDQLGPGVSVPFTLSQQANEGGGNGTNAKAGLNFVMAGLNKIPGVNTAFGTAPTASIAPDKDYRVEKIFNGMFNTAIPYYDDWRAFLGIVPNNPYRASGEGWLPGEQQDNIDPQTRMMLGPLGRTLGRGAGIGWFTPQDVFFDAEDQRKEIERRRLALQFEIGHPTSNNLPYEPEYTVGEVNDIVLP